MDGGREKAPAESHRLYLQRLPLTAPAQRTTQHALLDSTKARACGSALCSLAPVPWPRALHSAHASPAILWPQPPTHHVHHPLVLSSVFAAKPTTSLTSYVQTTFSQSIRSALRSDTALAGLRGGSRLTVPIPATYAAVKLQVKVSHVRSGFQSTGCIR